MLSLGACHVQPLVAPVAVAETAKSEPEDDEDEDRVGCKPLFIAHNPRVGPMCEVTDTITFPKTMCAEFAAHLKRWLREHLDDDLNYFDAHPVLVDGEMLTLRDYFLIDDDRRSLRQLRDSLVDQDEITRMNAQIEEKQAQVLGFFKGLDPLTNGPYFTHAEDTSRLLEWLDIVITNPMHQPPILENVQMISSATVALIPPAVKPHAFRLISVPDEQAVVLYTNVNSPQGCLSSEDADERIRANVFGLFFLEMANTFWEYCPDPS